MKKRYLLLALTVLMGMAMLAVDNYTQEIADILTESTPDTEADYYGEGLRNRQFGEQGQLQQQFIAKSSRHIPALYQTQFTQPVIQARTDDSKLWQVSAQSGTMNDRENILRLRQNIHIHPLQPDPSNLSIRTESLNYHMNEQLALTDKLVTIKSTASHISATGMKLDIRKEHITFNAKVSTRHVPQKTSVE